MGHLSFFFSSFGRAQCTPLKFSWFVLICADPLPPRAGPSSEQVVDLDDLANDPDLEKLHRDRLRKMKAEAEETMKMSRKGHGELRTIEEKDFLPQVTGSERVIAHFFHRDFSRCRIMDQHLEARKIELAHKNIQRDRCKREAGNCSC